MSDQIIRFDHALTRVRVNAETGFVVLAQRFHDDATEPQNIGIPLAHLRAIVERAEQEVSRTPGDTA